MSEDHRSCDKFMPLEIASNNAKTSSLYTSYAKSIFTIYTPLGSRNVFVDSGTWITPGI
jgi:hypothetical protein